MKTQSLVTFTGASLFLDNSELLEAGVLVEVLVGVTMLRSEVLE